jgi:hypothetical protein
VILRLLREPSRFGATLGSLYIDGHWEAFTLEDENRERAGVPVRDWKIKGQTAIPAGRYRVIIAPSHRFKRPLPLLLDVPGFEGIRIHPGNGPADTEGCILVGRDRVAGRVLQSRVAFEALFSTLQAAPGDIWIDIRNPEASEALAA